MTLSPGRKSLDRGSTFSAERKPLERKPFKRLVVLGDATRPPRLKRRRSVVNDRQRQRAEAWAHHARSRSCAVCGSLFVVGHHVITKQQLRHWARTKRLDSDQILYDVRNCLSLCDGCHADHHSWARRLTLPFVLKHCPKLHQFASELGLVWWLERNYPDPEATS
jgi:hypothetical protein